MNEVEVLCYISAPHNNERQATISTCKNTSTTY